MESEEPTEVAQIEPFQEKIGVLVGDADFCLRAARERRESDQLFAILHPVVEALLFDILEMKHAFVPDRAREGELFEALGIEGLGRELEVHCQLHLDQLERLDEETPKLAIVTHCNRASGKGQAILIELENRLSRLLGVRPSTTRTSDLESALAIRRLYVRFDRALNGLESLDDRVILAGRLLRNMTESEVWPKIRVADQIRFEELADAVDEAGAEDPKLWRTIDELGSRLRQIGRRPALVRHDVELLERLLEMLEAEAISTAIGEAFVRESEPTRFISDDLDELFRHGTSATAGEWRFRLAAARDTIINRSSDRFAADTTEMSTVETVEPLVGDL